MNSLKILLLFFPLCWFAHSANAQKDIADSTISFGMVNLSYGTAFPGGDLADRYGYFNYLSPEIGYKLSNNFYAYTGVRFLFGTQIKETVASNVVILTDDGSGVSTTRAVGTDGRLYEVRYFHRGFAVPLMFGKIFSFGKKTNPNSGIYIEAGPQFFQNKIKIEVQGESVPALSQEMKKGYDRLANGFGLAEGIGYRYYSNRRLINFYAGIDLSQNFTQVRRSVNYDTGVVENQPRTDLTFGFKLGWMFLIYQSAPDDFYYY